MNTIPSSPSSDSSEAPSLFGHVVDRSSSASLTDQVYRILVAEITAGRWNIGERLPSITALSEQASEGHQGALSRWPIQRAIERLEEAGYVRIEGRRGTYLVSRPAAQDATGRPIYFAMNRELANGLAFEVFYSSILRGAEQSARGFGRDLIFRTWEDESELLTLFENPKPAGLILINVSNLDLVAKLQARAPVVVLNKPIRGLRCDTVAIDNTEAIRQVVEHLVKKGHRRIAYLDFSTRPEQIGIDYTYLDRAGGYCEGLIQHGLPLRDEYLVHMKPTVEAFDPREGPRLPKGILLQLMDLPEPPTALITFNDWLGIGVVHCAREMGISIPDDLSVVGFDNLYTTSMMQPALTTVEPERGKMSQVAIELLERRIAEGRWDNPVKILCGSMLIERDSVADISASASDAAPVETSRVQAELPV